MLLSLCVETLASALVLMPVFLLLKKVCCLDVGRTLAYYLFALYLSVVYIQVGMPLITAVQYYSFSPRIQWPPVLRILTGVGDTVLNVMLFVPLGLMLPLLWRNYRKWQSTVGFGFCLSAFIEVVQMFTGRATDVDDLITNTFGTLIGYAVARLLWNTKPFRRPGRQKSDVIVLCSIAALVNFSFQPVLANAIWNWLM